MIKLEKIRDLNIDPNSHPRQSYLSAASGLVCLDAALYMIANDELHFGVFPLVHQVPLTSSDCTL
ncbi:hypothetical protein [Ensifer canadensis]